jgi:hypothetical protein
MFGLDLRGSKFLTAIHPTGTETAQWDFGAGRDERNGTEEQWQEGGRFTKLNA